jgi:hypothetical protein
MTNTIRDEDGRRRTVNVGDRVEAGVVMINSLIGIGIPDSSIHRRLHANFRRVNDKEMSLGRNGLPKKCWGHSPTCGKSYYI